MRARQSDNRASDQGARLIYYRRRVDESVAIDQQITHVQTSPETSCSALRVPSSALLALDALIEEQLQPGREATWAQRWDPRQAIRSLRKTRRRPKLLLRLQRFIDSRVAENDRLKRGERQGRTND
jgi:hypothetical protein